MSEDKCLYCGAGIEKKHKGLSRLHCGSVRYDSDGTFDTFYNRHIQCYETELTALKALVREMVKVVQSAAVNLPDHKEQWPCHCRSCAVGAILRAILSRPEVRKILQGENK